MAKPPADIPLNGPVSPKDPVPLKDTRPLKDREDTAETRPLPLPAAAESDWVSAHVFYQGDLTELLVNGIVPLTRELTHDGMAALLCGTPGWFFLRYWEGGPHLRLRVLPALRCDRAVIEALITERLGQHLREQPSTELMRQA